MTHLYEHILAYYKLVYEMYPGIKRPVEDMARLMYNKACKRIKQGKATEAQILVDYPLD